MATHYVKCPICGEKFDTLKVPFVQVSVRRWAHASCAEKGKTKEETDREKLEAYIKFLLQIDYLPPRVYKQLKEFTEKYHYSYSGIHRTLQYFYEVKKNDLAKSNQGIGIVPYVYQEAYNYYYAIWLAKQSNAGKENQKSKVIEVRIPSPERRLFRKKKFTFLDEEVMDE